MFQHSPTSQPNSLPKSPVPHGVNVIHGKETNLLQYICYFFFVTKFYCVSMHRCGYMIIVIFSFIKSVCYRINIPRNHTNMITKKTITRKNICVSRIYLLVYTDSIVFLLTKKMMGMQKLVSLPTSTCNGDVFPNNNTNMVTKKNYTSCIHI